MNNLHINTFSKFDEAAASESIPTHRYLGWHVSAMLCHTQTDQNHPTIVKIVFPTHLS
jgi:hypothetical protein